MKYLKLLLLVPFFVFSSCVKDDNHLSSDIRVFATEEDLIKEIENILSLPSHKVSAYENSNGFNSFGSKSDKLYQSINFDNFKSTDEIIEFVKKNSTYLQLIVEDDGDYTLETKLFKQPERYLLNSDRMLQVGDKLFKYFEEGVLVSSVDEYEYLKSVSEMDFELYQQTGGKVDDKKVLDATYNCGNFKEWRQTNDRDRTYVSLGVAVINQTSSGAQYGTYVAPRLLVRPYKKTLGVWYWCSRTISLNYKYAVDYTDNLNNWKREIVSGNVSRYDSKIELLGTHWVTLGYTWPVQAHLGGYDIWADTPSTSPVSEECNTSLF